MKNIKGLLTVGLALAFLGTAFSSCRGADQPLTFSGLVSQAARFNAQTVTFEAFYFSGFEISALSESVGPSSTGTWRIVPVGTLIWVEGGISQELQNSLYGQTDTPSGYTERIGKLKVTGKFESGGKYGHLDAYDYSITVTKAELLEWTPPPVQSYSPGAPSPQLIREPPAINFFARPGENPPAEQLLISAISGPLDWSLTNDAAWLRISSSAGTASSGKETIMLTADASALAAGIHETTLIFLQVGSEWSQGIPVKLFITNAVPGTTLAVPVQPASGTAFEEGISLSGTSVVTGVVEKSGSNPWGGSYFDAGDLCLLVRGEFRNATDEPLTVDFFAEAYAADGRQVAWTLTSGPLSGIAQRDVADKSGTKFELALTWAENVHIIKIVANIHHWPK